MAGTGSLRQRGPNTWELRVSLGVDPVTRRYRQATKTVRGNKTDARRALAAFMARHGAHTAADITFGAHAEEWLAGAELANTTRRRYRSLLDTWVLPALGALKLAKVTAYALDRLYAHMTAQGQSSASVRQAHAIVRRCLGQAVKWDRLEANPAAKATPPSLRGGIRPVPDADTVRRFLEAASSTDEGLAALFWLGAATGARRGELCGLQWSHIDLGAGEVRICQAVEGAGSQMSIKDTKTHQERRLGLDPATVEVLSYHRQRVDALATLADVEVGPDGFAFSPDPAGRWPWHPDTVSHRFAAVRNAAGLSHFTLHGLRHWMATVSLREGADVRSVAGRLGHRDASVTLRVYAHVLAAGDRDVATKVGRLLAPTMESAPAPSR